MKTKGGISIQSFTHIEKSRCIDMAVHRFKDDEEFSNLVQLLGLQKHAKFYPIHYYVTTETTPGHCQVMPNYFVSMSLHTMAMSDNIIQNILNKITSRFLIIKQKRKQFPLFD